MTPSNPEEIIIALGLCAIICFLIIAIGSGGLSMFAGLKRPPTERAFLTACPAYLIAVILGVFGGPSGWGFLWPVAAIPGGLIAFWYWRWEFRKAWVDDPAQLPEGVGVIDDDWRNGLLKLLALLTAATVVALSRWFLRS